jgi:hypothetical protein
LAKRKESLVISYGRCAYCAKRSVAYTSTSARRSRSMRCSRTCPIWKTRRPEDEARAGWRVAGRRRAGAANHAAR